MRPVRMLREMLASPVSVVAMAKVRHGLSPVAGAVGNTGRKLPESIKQTNTIR